MCLFVPPRHPPTWIGCKFIRIAQKNRYIFKRIDTHETTGVNEAHKEVSYPWYPKTKIADAEIHEILYPILTLYRKELPDTGGIGEFRGGNALATAFMPWDAGSPLTNVGLSHGFEARVGNGVTGG